jgi:SAM-dependent methyltransferase
MTMPRHILAPYMATPADVVERMVRLAEVGEGDVVYDLGCGDGRMAIAAGRRGAHAVGVDIEPYWIEQARSNAAAAGVSARVSFEQRDALELDLAPATVVFMYLVQWSTQRVAAQILGQCAVGTRVVSHSFGFDTVAARSETFEDASGQPRTLHLWVAGDNAVGPGADPARGAST